MDQIQRLFLQAVRASLTGEQVSWTEPLPAEQWGGLFQLAEIHHVLPMVFEAVYACPSARQTDPRLMMQAKGRMIQLVMLQTRQTAEFLDLYRHLSGAGLEPLVVKGIVCRSLYPKPDYRLSGDEDLLLPPEEFESCHQAMLAYGMQPADPGQDLAAADEVPYGKPGSPLYIELHKSLFPPQSDAYGDLNRFFTDARAESVLLTFQGTPVRTMNPTDHLLYLICHAFKHFLHSGFGLRQVCDIALFANAYGPELDWQQVLECCREIRADQFAAALFRIGEKYLTFDPAAACYPVQWREIQVDEGMLLEELLASGVYGDSSLSRKHSSNMTLEAVAAQKQGKRQGSGLLKSVFPPAKALENRYPYLKKKPYLLPVAWGDRILRYRKETQANPGSDAAEAMKIGSQRIELLRAYGILK